MVHLIKIMIRKTFIKNIDTVVNLIKIIVWKTFIKNIDKYSPPPPPQKKKKLSKILLVFNDMIADKQSSMIQYIITQISVEKDLMILIMQ